MLGFSTEVKAARSISPANNTTTTTGAAVDCAGYDEALIVFNHGAMAGGSSPTIDVKLQECATSGGSYVDIAGAVFTQITTANDDAINVGRLRLDGARKQFIKAIATVGGSPTTAIYGVEVILGAKNFTGQPQAMQWEV
jgi:hypothetical protein